MLLPDILASDRAVLNWATVKEPNDAAFPTDVTCPVKLAFVVTVAAFPVVDPEEPVTLVCVPVSVTPLAVTVPAKAVDRELLVPNCTTSAKPAALLILV